MQMLIYQGCLGNGNSYGNGNSHGNEMGMGIVFILWEFPQIFPWEFPQVFPWGFPREFPYGNPEIPYGFS